MVAARTTTTLLADVRALAMVADAEGRLSSQEILDIASRVLSTDIADILVSSRQQRWVTTYADITLTANQPRYRVPSRALAGGVDDIVAVSSAGFEIDIPEVDAGDRAWYTGTSRAAGWGMPFCYCWEGDFIVLLPTPDTGIASGYTMRIRYPRQPARLVPVTSCAPITAVGGSTVTATSAATILGSTATVDIVQGVPPSDVLGMDLSASCSGSTVTVAVPSGTAVGDYVTPAGSTCVPPCPESVWPALVSGTALRVVRAFGDAEGVARLSEEHAQTMVQVRNIIEPRSRNAARPIFNRYSALRSGRGRWR